MTEQEKQLLLKDLCGRLPYVTYARIVEADCFDKSESVTEGCVGGYSNTRMCQDYSMDEIFEFIESGDAVKPYLRPMSSMSEEERIEFSKLLDKRYCEIDFEGHISTSYCIEIDNVYTDDENGIKFPSSFSMDAIDWLNAHHFDYRGLIDMGLALEAPEGMYNI